jgi:hypothetical protein
MNIPKDATMLYSRSANSKTPPRVEREMDFGDGYSPRSARFGGGDERYTLALASRVKLNFETSKDKPLAPNESHTSQQTPEGVCYTSIFQAGEKMKAAVALFNEDSGRVSVSEYSWQA